LRGSVVQPALLVLSLVLLQAPAVPPRDAGEAISVRGRVLDSATGAPLPGAIIAVVTAQGEAAPLRAEAAEDGAFQLRVWQDGRLAGVNLVDCCLSAGALKQGLLRAATGAVSEMEATWISFNG